MQSSGGLTTHSTGARIEWLSSFFAAIELDTVLRARLIRALDSFLLRTKLYEC
jgi:hypothetical protein